MQAAAGASNFGRISTAGCRSFSFTRRGGVEVVGLGGLYEGVFRGGLDAWGCLGGPASQRTPPVVPLDPPPPHPAPAPPLSLRAAQQRRGHGVGGVPRAGRHRPGPRRPPRGGAAAGPHRGPHPRRAAVLPLRCPPPAHLAPHTSRWFSLSHTQQRSLSAGTTFSNVLKLEPCRETSGFFDLKKIEMCEIRDSGWPPTPGSGPWANTGWLVCGK